MSRGPALAAAITILAAACSFSFSVGGVDYEGLEASIGEELDASYAAIDRSVTGVDCAELAEDPEPGDTFICTADLEGERVRVQVEVTDDEGNVSFDTLDIVYDLPDTAELLAADISAQLGGPVNLNCGEGIAVVAIGESFLCTAIDADQATATVEVTANGIEDTSWRLVE